MKAARRCQCAPLGRRACVIGFGIVFAAAMPRLHAQPNAAKDASTAQSRAASAAAVTSTRTRVELAAFEWLAGEWVIDDARQRIEETWTRPAADLMLGMSRTLVDGRTIAFEFMRIAARPDGVFYIAQPRGKPPVEFPLQSWDGTTAVFVNDGNGDHLKRILYRHDGARLTASIEGANDGQEFTETYPYRRAAAAPQSGGDR